MLIRHIEYIIHIPGRYILQIPHQPILFFHSYFHDHMHRKMKLLSGFSQTHNIGNNADTGIGDFTMWKNIPVKNVTPSDSKSNIILSTLPTGGNILSLLALLLISSSLWKPRVLAHSHCMGRGTRMGSGPGPGTMDLECLWAMNSYSSYTNIKPFTWISQITPSLFVFYCNCS